MTATLIGRIVDTGVLTDAELDWLAEGFLWDDRFAWPVPAVWIRDGFVRPVEPATTGTGRVYLERPIAPPLRRWATARVVRAELTECAAVLDRITELEARSGDAVMVGLLDACDGLPAAVGGELVELGCGWPAGTVRLRALELVAASAPEIAMVRAAGDPSGKVRAAAQRWRPTIDAESMLAVSPGTVAGGTPQLALFA